MLAGFGATAGASPEAVYLSVLLGATAGFLVYNLHPARLFLGDSGSLLIGLSLAVMALEPGQAVTPRSDVVSIIAVTGARPADSDPRCNTRDGFSSAIGADLPPREGQTTLHTGWSPSGSRNPQPSRSCGALPRSVGSWVSQSIFSVRIGPASWRRCFSWLSRSLLCIFSKCGSTRIQMNF